MERIASFLGRTVICSGVVGRLGGTVTWTGKLSHWQDVWSDEIDDAWCDARGPDIERMFGYG